MADEWETITAEDEWETVQPIEQPTESEWENVPEPEQAPLYTRAGGAVKKGFMSLGEALVDLPKHAVNQVKLGMTTIMRQSLLTTTNPRDRADTLKAMDATEGFLNKVTSELGKAGELHRIGQASIIKNHPEWESEPPKSFTDLFTSPDKLIVSLAESLPLLP